MPHGMFMGDPLGFILDVAPVHWCRDGQLFIGDPVLLPYGPNPTEGILPLRGVSRTRRQPHELDDSMKNRRSLGHYLPMGGKEPGLHALDGELQGQDLLGWWHTSTVGTDVVPIHL